MRNKDERAAVLPPRTVPSTVSNATGKHPQFQNDTRGLHEHHPNTDRAFTNAASPASRIIWGRSQEDSLLKEMDVSRWRKR